MRVKNSTIYAAKEPLGQLAKEVLPIKTSYWIAKLGRQVASQWGLVEELRVKLIRQYGVADEKGNISVDPRGDNYVPFLSDWNAVLTEEAEIALDQKIKIQASGDLKVSAVALMALDDFVEIEGV